MANHDVTVVEDGKWADKPWYVFCSCKGPEGRFATRGEAEGFGGVHIGRRGGEITVKTMAELEKEKTPAPPTPQPVAQQVAKVPPPAIPPAPLVPATKAEEKK